MLLKRLTPCLFIFAVALFLINSANLFPYNLYPSLIIIFYAILMESIRYMLAHKAKIRLIIIWLFAIIVPPVWNANWMILLYGEKPPIVSYDVALPATWMFITIILYIYSISVSLIETFEIRKKK
jgi:hypothetical protein